MITRIVMMTFEQTHIESFLDIFAQSRESIAAFPGCRSLRLLRAAEEGGVFFTISIWESEDALENYRSSNLFRTTWARTKALFSDRARAWTTEELYTG